MYTDQTLPQALHFESPPVLKEKKNQLLVFNIYHKTAQMFGPYDTCIKIL